MRRTYAVRRTYATLLIVIAISLILATLLAFGRMAQGTVSSGSWRIDLGSPQVVRLEAATWRPFEATLTDPLEAEYYSPEERSTRVVLTFTAYKLIPSEAKLAGDLSLEVPVPLKEKFRPELSEIVSCAEGKTGRKAQPRLEKDYADKNLVVRVQNDTGSSSVKIPIPLEDFLTSSIDSDSETCEEVREDIVNRPSQVRVPTELPVLAGSVSDYPTDYHQLSANVKITLPKGFTLSEDAQEGASESGFSPATLPHAIQLRSSPGMGGRTIYLFKQLEASLPLPRSIDEPRITAVDVDTMASRPTSELDVPLQDDVDLRLLIVRNWRAQLLVYAGALLPLVVIWLLILPRFLFHRTHNFAAEGLNLIGFGISVLALRTLLVPSDLEGLTRIDYILMIVIVQITSIAFLGNGLQLWSSAPEHSREDGNSLTSWRMISTKSQERKRRQRK